MIIGHEDKGGHGALICALKNPGLHQSVSAFAPIANPLGCPWGQKAFKGYLGDNQKLWKQWDSTYLAKTYSSGPIELFIDQGCNDNFLKEKQLLPENLLQAASSNDHLQTIYKQRAEYDHSYYYIATFMASTSAFIFIVMQNDVHAKAYKF